jgi:hypothetical protein
MHLHYLDEGNAYVNWFGYYIVNVSIGYYTYEVDDLKKL